jgi:hypothetical protein
MSIVIQLFSNQSNRRSMVQSDTSPFSIPWMPYLLGFRELSSLSRVLELTYLAFHS